MKRIIIFCCLVISLAVPACRPHKEQPVATVDQPAAGKTHHVGGSRLYPNPELTPGAVLADVAADEVCVRGYSKTVRDVSARIKKEVFARYGIANPHQESYEVDHFISLELGGSNDVTNLWPEPAEPRPGFHEKDKVENFLHHEVCAGHLTLKEAQDKIREDWYAVYLEMQSR